MWFGGFGNCTCTGAPPTPAVTFNWLQFISWFPEFSCMNEAQGEAFFARASMQIENSVRNPLWCTGILPGVLNLVTAHIAWLNAPRDANGNPAQSGTPASQVIGRISSASEGSVSVSTELGGEMGSPSEAYFVQTKYGFEAWQAMAAMRTARYAANPTIVVLAPWMPVGFWGGCGPTGGGSTGGEPGGTLNLELREG